MVKRLTEEQKHKFDLFQKRIDEMVEDIERTKKLRRKKENGDENFIAEREQK